MTDADSRVTTLGTIETQIITRSEELPEMASGDFFHSRDMFEMAERTPGQTPFMVVARHNDGTIAGHLLATLRRRGSLIPPYLFTQGRVYGCGVYADGADKEAVFRAMLAAITSKLRDKMCLYIEFSNLTHKMFGYKDFREQGYFPVHWMAVHISLHSKDPRERLTTRVATRIERARDAGVDTRVMEHYDDFAAFYKLLKNYFTLRLRRYLPPEKQLYEMGDNANSRIFITRFKGKVIGGCVCVYSGSDAYLWYMAAKNKSHPKLHPATSTVWAAIDYAYKHGYAHIHFMDVGLPFRKNPYRDFILSFGGKPVSTYRWFRFTFPLLNNVLRWIYRP